MSAIVPEHGAGAAVDLLTVTNAHERRLAVAHAAREHCLGRYPDEASAFLVVLGFYALADGDHERARELSETVVSRSSTGPSCTTNSPASSTEPPTPPTAFS